MRRAMNYLRWNLPRWASWRPLTTPTPAEQAAILTLRQAASAAASLDSVTTTSPAESEWLANTGRLKSLILRHDPRRFLRWDVIRSTMFVEQAAYLRTELNFLRHRPDWLVRWRPAIRESRVGQPAPYLAYPRSSGNLIHYAYHLARFEQQTRLPVSDFTHVFEFGGGYGGLCRLIHRLGFQGDYTIVDLPLFSALQEFYLTLTSAEEGPLDDRDAGRHVHFVSLSSFSTRPAPESARGLLVGTWSLSETSEHTRLRMLRQTEQCDGVLIAFQHRFGEVDNARFFDSWITTQPGFIWQRSPIEHLVESSYLFGARQPEA